MGHLKTIVEGSWDGEDGPMTDKYFLLHWGLRYELIPDAFGNLQPVHYTVGICQNIKSGAIEMFLPDQLKVLGQTVKEE